MQEMGKPQSKLKSDDVKVLAKETYCKPISSKLFMDIYHFNCIGLVTEKEIKQW